MPKRLLCADDSETIQRVVAFTFGRTDYQVIAAKSADDALAKARANPPDLILADAVMPGKTGYDLCQALKSDPVTQGCPVVIMCGNSQPFDADRGKTVGADGHILKPWDSQQLIDHLTELTGRVAQQGVARAAGGGGAAAAPSRPVASAAPAAAPVAQPMRPAPVAAAPLAAAPPVARPAPVPAAAAPPPRAATPPPQAAATSSRPAPPGSLPRPPAGLPRPPMIRGAQPGLMAQAQRGSTQHGTSTGVNQPPAPAQPAAAAGRRPGASATIMGMPAQQVPGVGAPGAMPVQTMPAAAPAHVAPAPVARPAPVEARPAQPVAVPSRSQVSPEGVARAVVPQITEAAHAQMGAMAGKGPEYEAIAQMSREVIERIAWEVVPQLAEAIIKEHVERLAQQNR